MESTEVGRANGFIIKLFLTSPKSNVARCPPIRRDVKPLNVLVQRNGACKLADFGTAGRLEDHHGCAGTLYYMPSPMPPWG